MFTVDTKVYTEVGDGSGDLARAAMRASVDASLRRLRREGAGGVNVLFAHRPDPATPLAEQIRGFGEEIARGSAKAWGVANHSAERLREILELCESEGWVKPAWYQVCLAFLRSLSFLHCARCVEFGCACLCATLSSPLLSLPSLPCHRLL